jgi:hypothetical protein
MLAAFDFYGWRRLCDRTAERAARLPTLRALPPRVYGAPWITDGCVLVSLSRWDHFVSAGCHSFLCMLFMSLVFLHRTLSIFHDPNAWSLRSPNSTATL